MNANVKALETSIWKKISSKMLFFIFATVLVIVFALYAYLVHKTIMNVVARQKAEDQIATLSGTIGNLELQYMTAQNSITLNLAYSKGFKEATPSQFIARGSSALSYNSH